MSVLAPIPDAWSARRPGRFRLLALGLCGWHDFDPVAASRALGESGKVTSSSGATLSRRERDALLLKLERDGREDEQLLGLPDDANVVALARKIQARRHPFWRALEDAMTVVGVKDPVGVRLLVEVFVDPGDGRSAVARCHALPYLVGGVDMAVEAPRYRLVRALVSLDEHLGVVDFPREIREQEAAWEQWLAAVRPRKTMSGRVVRADVDLAARRLRDRYVVELSRLAGWSQTRIAEHMGLSQQIVSRILVRGEEA